ncbi:MAG: flagellar biosynthesis protein FlgI [Arcobacter sp.]|nr:MAG: flagellar biosynthesis protein FlgI [Arcobacter sp.]
MKILLLLFFTFYSVYAVKIKDISNIVGIRDNQLIGYGLVVGLAGTGDKSQFTMQSLQNLLRNSYIKIPASSIKSKNIAAVMVTAELPAFSRQGDKIKVKISAIGDSKSINHGALLLTQLKAVDGQVYALAQGTIIADENNQTTGFIYEGATIENEVEYSLKGEDSIKLSLFKNDAKQAYEVQKRINEMFGTNLAIATDTRTVEIKKPNNVSIVKFISDIQEIELDSTFKKKIIIDMAREIIIAGADITIQPVTVARGNFTIRIKKSPLDDAQWEDKKINQGKDIGDDVRLDNKPIAVNIDNTLMNSKGTPTVSDLVRAMKVMKLPMTDIIDTIKMIKDLGALDVELEIRG